MGVKRNEQVKVFLEKENITSYSKLSSFLFDFSNYPTDKNFFEGKCSDYASSVLYLYSLYTRGKIEKLKDFFLNSETKNMWTQTDTGAPTYITTIKMAEDDKEAIQTKLTEGFKSSYRDYEDAETNNSMSDEEFEYYSLKYSKAYKEVLQKFKSAVESETQKIQELLSERQIGVKETTGKLSLELDFDFVKQMAERMDTNKGKYEKWNWKKPMDVRELSEATMRHCMEVIEGRYEDDGRPYGHLEALATNSMMLNYQLKNKI